MLARLSEDWRQRWGHPIALVETFVDPHRFLGTAYKVSAGPTWVSPKVGNGMPPTYAASLSQAQLRALRFRCERGSHWIRSPKRTTFARVLAAVDAGILQQILLAWQAQVLGPSDNRFVIVDGKKLRHDGQEIVNAVDGTGRFLGSVVTQTKSNEIPAARLVLEPLNLGG